MRPGRANRARGVGRSPSCQGREDAAWQSRRRPGGTGWGRQRRAPSRAGLQARARLSAARSGLFWKGGVSAEHSVCGAADAREQDGSQVPAMPCGPTPLGVNLPQHNQDWIPNA